MSTEPEHTQDNRHRRRLPFAVASVAAAVLLAGGGGAYWASSAADDGGGGGGSGGRADGGDPPPLALDTAASESTGPVSGIAPGEPDPSGRVVYRATGELPEGPDSAAVYRAAGTVTAAEVNRLAQALGLPASAHLEGGSWRIGTPGSGPSLRVDKAAPGTWSYAKYGPGGTDNCLKGKSCSGGAMPPNGEGAAVSEEVAKRAAAPVLKAVGQEGAELDAGQLMSSVRVVNADPKVGGLPTVGWSTGIQVGTSGEVVGGSGYLKEPVKGDAYPVIGADEALKELNEEGRVGAKPDIGGCATSEPLGVEPPAGAGQPPMDTGISEPDGPVEPVDPAKPGSTEPVRPGESPITCEPRRPAGPPTLDVSGAVFGLAAHSVDGRQALVPSWLFEVAPKGAPQPFTITHPAVEPRFLTKPAAPPEPPRDSPGTGSDAAARHVVSYGVDARDGRTLTVRFWGGVCSEYSARAVEDGGAVRVTVDEAKDDSKKACIMLAKELTEKVVLKQPLDGRKVVDAATGGTVPRG
ncbi:hypothetical protein [Streptomyces sp. NPDC050504]|uniref:hypothetical protein n=1 Tax=Streptomyces sp. NPDC050504 TaxID=3365618 RepID=UPI00378AC39F